MIVQVSPHPQAITFVSVVINRGTGRVIARFYGARIRTHGVDSMAMQEGEAEVVEEDLVDLVVGDSAVVVVGGSGVEVEVVSFIEAEAGSEATEVVPPKNTSQ